MFKNKKRRCNVKTLKSKRVLFFVIWGFLFLLGFYCAKKEKEGDLKSVRLIDFQPKPMLVVKETKIEKAKFPVIDAHNHLRRLARPGEDIAQYVKIMDECNVKMVVNLDGGWGGALDSVMKKMKEPYPDRFIIYTNLDYSKINEPDYPDYIGNLVEESIKKGAQALKISKSLGLGVKEADGSYLRVDSPKLDKAWDVCGKYGVPVTIHIGDPLAFFTPLDRFNERLEELMDHPGWMFNKPEFYTIDQLFEQRDNLLQKHRNTNFIGAHIGGFSEDLQRAGEYLDKHPNLYYDTSARIHEMGRQPYTARKFLIKYADRIVFGTDGCDSGAINANMYHLNWRWYESDDEYFDVAKGHHYQGRWMVYGIFLADDVLQKIYNGTAKKLYPSLKNVKI